MLIPFHNGIKFDRGHWYAHLLVLRFIQRLDDFVPKALHAVNCFGNVRHGEANVTEANSGGRIRVVIAGCVWHGRVGGDVVKLQKAL